MKKRLFPNLHIRDSLGFFLTTNHINRFLFKQNRSIIFNRSTTRKILSFFKTDLAHNIDNETGNLGYGFIHYSLILNIKPKRVLCIGSRRGFVPAICALACQENGLGSVDFVDAGLDKSHSKSWTGEGWWKKIQIDKYFSFLDINRWLKAYIMTSEQFFRKHAYRYEYIYIDADHSYEGVKKDYHLYWKRLNKYGFMVFHDVSVKKQKNLPPFGIWRFWKEIQANKIIFPFPKESGLGIIQKLK